MKLVIAPIEVALLLNFEENSTSPSYSKSPTNSRDESMFMCVSLCVCLSVTEIPAARMHVFGHCFRQLVAYRNGLDPIEIDDIIG